jgi:hypothetical protein
MSWFFPHLKRLFALFSSFSLLLHLDLVFCLRQDMTGYEQSFWTRSSTGTITIPTRVDNKTGNRIILWKDIQQYFKNAQGVLNGGKAVLFLTDGNFE